MATPTDAGTWFTTTSYGYASPQNSAGGNVTPIAGEGVPFLSTVTDPRGLVTSIHYSYDTEPIPALRTHIVSAWKIVEPNGVTTYFGGPNGSYIIGDTTNLGKPRGIPSGAPSGYGASDTPLYRVEAAGGLILVPDKEFSRTYTAPTQNAPGYVTVHDGPVLPAADSVWQKSKFDAESLMQLESVSSFRGSAAQAVAGGMPDSLCTVTKTTSSNFLGAPLSETVVEQRTTTAGGTTRTFETEHAYWGRSKYFQQKFARSKDAGAGTPWRYTWSDYFDSSAALGRRGQASAVYDARHATPHVENVGDPNHFRDQATLNSAAVPNATFDYDSRGRPITVDRRKAGAAVAYVRTASTYGGDGAQAYFNATSVTEAQGLAEQRTTQTHAFHWSGKASDTTDANGRRFKTTYEFSGAVMDVEQVRADGSFFNPRKYVLKNAYGVARVATGQPVEAAAQSPPAFRYTENRMELLIEVREDPEGGFSARGLGAAIFTEADDLESLKAAIRAAVSCHFEPGDEPKFLRLLIVREEIIAA